MLILISKSSQKPFIQISLWVIPLYQESVVIIHSIFSSNSHIHGKGWELYKRRSATKDNVFTNKERAIFLWHGPKWRVEYSTIRTYCVRSVSYYSYYYSSSFFLPPKFGRHISRKCFDQTLWNLVGISYAMWSCTFKCWFFSKWLPLLW